MNQRMQYLLLFVSVFLLNSSAVAGLTGCWECAEKEYLNGEYRKSALSYELLYFEQSEDSSKAMALLGKLSCLEKLKNREAIDRCFNRLNLLNVDQGLKLKIQLRKSWYLISVGNLSLAEFTLDQLNESSLKRKEHSQYWLAKYSIALKNYNQEEALLIYTTHIQPDSSLEGKFEKKLSRKHLFKSEKTAKTLSTFVPGMGQLYAGRPDHMLYSLIFIGSSVAYTVGSFVTGYYVTGALTGIPLTLKFYFGGRQNAAQLVERKNNRIIDRLTIKKINNGP